MRRAKAHPMSRGTSGDRRERHSASQPGSSATRSVAGKPSRPSSTPAVRAGGLHLRQSSANPQLIGVAGGLLAASSHSGQLLNHPGSDRQARRTGRHQGQASIIQLGQPVRLPLALTCKHQCEQTTSPVAVTDGETNPVVRRGRLSQSGCSGTQRNRPPSCGS